jgi:hypothetical protein
MEKDWNKTELLGFIYVFYATPLIITCQFSFTCSVAYLGQHLTCGRIFYSSFHITHLLSQVWVSFFFFLFSIFIFFPFHYAPVPFSITDAMNYPSTSLICFTSLSHQENWMDSVCWWSFMPIVSGGLLWGDEIRLMEVYWIRPVAPRCRKILI